MHERSAAFLRLANLGQGNRAGQSRGAKCSAVHVARSSGLPELIQCVIFITDFLPQLPRLASTVANATEGAGLQVAQVTAHRSAHCYESPVARRWRKAVKQMPHNKNVRRSRWFSSKSVWPARHRVLRRPLPPVHLSPLLPCQGNYHQHGFKHTKDPHLL